MDQLARKRLEVLITSLGLPPRPLRRGYTTSTQMIGYGASQSTASVLQTMAEMTGSRRIAVA